MEELNIIQGLISLGPSGILALIAFKLWAVYQKQLDYNRDQDKSNIESIHKMMGLIDRLNDSQKGGDSATHELLKELRQLIIDLNHKA